MSDYKKLKEIYNEIDVLISHNVSSSSPEFRAWYDKAERFLINKYGEESPEYRSFKKKHFSLTAISSSTSEREFVIACKNDLIVVKSAFKDYLEELDEKVEADIKKVSGASFSEVFIVHGHDGCLKEAVARLLDQQNIKPIILNEQVNQGATIIEKLERYTNVPFAICLFTADDYGRLKEENKENIDKKRARQNVIFETGFLMGKLGRKNIMIIAEEGIEIPSDLNGIVYTDKSDWKNSLLSELKSIGYEIDANKII